LSKNISEKEWEGKGLLGLGKCYEKMKNTEHAIEILEKSL